MKWCLYFPFPKSYTTEGYYMSWFLAISAPLCMCFNDIICNIHSHFDKTAEARIRAAKKPHGRKWQEECPTLVCRAPRLSTASYHDYSLQAPAPSFPLSSLTPGRWLFLFLTFIKLKSLPSSFWQGLMRLSRQSILKPSTAMPPYARRHS